MDSSHIKNSAGQGRRVWLWLIIPLFLYFLFGLNHLAKFETTDEHYWVYEPDSGRIHEYWQAVATHDWLGTKINDKPGITVCLLSGAGMLFDTNPPDRATRWNQDYKIYQPEITLNKNFRYRLPILIFNGLSSILFFFLIKKITDDDWTALFSASLILLSPTLVGISQIVNPDSILWTFMLATILSFVCFMKNLKVNFAVLSSIFLGFSLLTKYSSFLLIPFMFLSIIFFLIFKYQSDAKETFALTIKRSFTFFPIIVIGAFVIFSFFMPAVLAKPDIFKDIFSELKGIAPIVYFLIGLETLILIDIYLNKSRILSSIIGKFSNVKKWIVIFFYSVLLILFLLTLANWISGNWFKVSDIPFDAHLSKSFSKLELWEKIFLENRVLIFTLTPIVLLFSLFTWSKAILHPRKESFYKYYLSSFILIYFAAVISQNLLIDTRYGIILYPILICLSAIGITEFVSLFKKVAKMKILMLIVIIIIGVYSLLSISPFYFDYNNALLKKSETISDAWGYGQYEAAQYLNGQENSENLIVWTDHEGFCPFFRGRCLRGNELENIRDEEITNFDYVVKSRRGSILMSEKWDKINSFIDLNPVWRLNIGDRNANYVMILKHMK